MAAVPLGGGPPTFDRGLADRTPSGPLGHGDDGGTAGWLADGLSDYVEAPTDPTLADPTLGDPSPAGQGPVAAAPSGALDDGPRRPTSIDVESLDPLPPLLPGAAGPSVVPRTGPPPASATPSQALAALTEDEVVPDDEAAAARPRLAPPVGAPPGDGEPARRSLRGVLEDMLEADTVVALVNGEEIAWRSVLRSAEALPEGYEDRMESVFPALLQRLIDLKLLAQAAREAGYESRADIRNRVRDYEDALLREALLRELLADEVSDEMLQQAYQDYAEAARSHLQVRARHILLESEADARAVIQALDQGADFARLARERSLGSSAARGGDLGTVDIGRMVPQFGAALASLPVGRHGAEPVETEFGWHVILVEERSGTDAAELDTVAPQLRRALARGAIEERLGALRGAAEIEIVPPDEEDPDRRADGDTEVE